MKSLVSILASAIAAGLVAGAALGYWEARPWTAGNAANAHSHAEHDHDHGNGSQEGAGAAVDAAPKGPVAVVPDTVFRFGNMEMNTTMQHAFPIQNTGDKPLRVTFVAHTCKCTKVLLEGKEVDVDDFMDVPPGGGADVELEWAAKVTPGPFRHGATFSTNDPQSSRLEFTVEGEIVGTDAVQPTQFAFGALRAGDKGTAEVYVMSFLDEEVTIDSAEVIEPDLAKRLVVRVEKVDKASLPDKNATAGAKVVATYDAGGAIGPFGGSIRLKTNLKKSPELQIPVGGVVKGDVSLFGRGWNEQLGLVRMEPMTSAAGGSAKLNITIRGEHVAETRLEIKSVAPKELHATLSERKDLSPRLAQQAIILEVPAGARPMVMAGEAQGGEGEIVLATGHPVTPELKLRVQFTVSP